LLFVVVQNLIAIYPEPLTASSNYQQQMTTQLEKKLLSKIIHSVAMLHALRNSKSPETLLLAMPRVAQLFRKFSANS